jgi:acetyl-CoA carboxylase biotin carboxyl carrier protein
LDLKEIKQIVEMMKRNDLSYFHITSGDFRLKLRRGVDAEIVAEAIASARGATPHHHAAPAPAPSQDAPTGAPAATPASTPTPPPHQPAPDPEPAHTINSPMVGTFYRASSPGAPPFVKVGDQVDEDTVVCIIEAMKVMNEIKAEMKGTIVKVIADDTTPVQYGEHLFEIKP